ncbi:Cytochrome P450 [Sphingomonas sp. YR710]|jgi:cytochrome P450|uniref:cytochrome P450 n=1 Tax=Sphingomonas sp. YR710 TaxID=1882773 RepID=UPI00088083B9|nr:cytochrome P450 [Sphingomonas sp. YR710]SDB99761.1 Cytochrome P450 [Sphingomonas sp. YR710]
MNQTTATPTCPVAGRDDRKSAELAREHVSTFEGAKIVPGFAGAREVLRSTNVRQAGSNSSEITFDNPAHISFFFLDGDAHRKRRASVAAYFTPKAIVTRYHPIIDRTMAKLTAEFQATGSGVLDEMALELASNVTVEILGIDDRGNPLALAKLFHAIRRSSPRPNRSAFQRFFQDRLFGWHFHAPKIRLTAQLYDNHIAPAIVVRRSAPKDDVVSYMIKEGYSKAAMIMECMTYGSAGVSTTREFIGMAAWHMLDRPELKQRFLDADEEGQFAILQEILRLEPVSGMLYRRAQTDMPDAKGGPIKAGDLMAIDLRSANIDPETVGECPFALDPERSARMKIVGNYMTFGDGPHRCPGSQVALHEGRMFLDSLMRVPGIRLAKQPQMLWNRNTQGYEIREMVIECDKIS